MGEAALAQVDGFRFERMNVKLVDAAVKRHSVKVQRGMQLTNKVGLLQIHYKKTHDPGDLIECDECGAVSPTAEDACPFCGFGGSQPGGPETQKLVPSKKNKTATPSTKVLLDQGSKTEPASADLVTVNEPEALATLDETVRQIVALKAGADASQWLLGRKIAEAYEQKAWRFRRDDKGKPKYRAFAQFCIAEFELTARQCYRYIDLATHFTEDQARAFGMGKLALVANLEPTDRSSLVTRIGKEELSLRQVEQEVRRLNPRPSTPPSGQSTVTHRLPEGAAATSIVIGTKSYPLYCKPATKDAVLTDQKKAKTIADSPVFCIELPNDLRMTIQIIEGSTGLVAKVVTHKADALEV